MTYFDLVLQSVLQVKGYKFAEGVKLKRLPRPPTADETQSLAVTQQQAAAMPFTLSKGDAKQCA